MHVSHDINHNDNVLFTKFKPSVNLIFPKTPLFHISKEKNSSVKPKTNTIHLMSNRKKLETNMKNVPFSLLICVYYHKIIQKCHHI